MSKDKTISIKLVKSGIGRMENHKLCIKGLGFKKLNQTVKVYDEQIQNRPEGGLYRRSGGREEITIFIYKLYYFFKIFAPCIFSAHKILSIFYIIYKFYPRIMDFFL